MRQHARVCLVAILLACLAPVAAHADGGAAVPVHVGTHPGYGRVVFDLPERLDFHLTQQGQQVQVQFTGNVTIGAAPAMPPNVLGLTGSAGQAELVVVEGTVARAWRLGNRLVIDVLDPAVAASTPSAPVQASVPAPRSGSASAAAPGAPVAKPAVPMVSPAVRRLPAPRRHPPFRRNRGHRRPHRKCSRRRRLHPWRSPPQLRVPPMHLPRLSRNRGPRQWHRKCSQRRPVYPRRRLHHPFRRRSPGTPLWVRNPRQFPHDPLTLLLCRSRGVPATGIGAHSAGRSGRRCRADSGRGAGGCF